jgi:hypothetical protein
MMTTKHRTPRPWDRAGNPALELEREGLDFATIYACRGALEARLVLVDGRSSDALWSWALYGTGAFWEEVQVLGIASIHEMLARWREAAPVYRAALARVPLPAAPAPGLEVETAEIV